MPPSNKCDLHIPHKEWANDARELQNYAAIERWAQLMIHGGCGGACACWIGKKTLTPTVDDNTENLTILPFASMTALAGVYAGGNCIVVAQALWPDATTGALELSLTSTNSPTANAQTIPGVNTGGRGQAMSTAHLSQVDQVDIVLWQNSGGPLTPTVTVGAYEICACKVEFGA